MRNYEDLTEYQKDMICNGCGGKGGWVKPPHAAFFKTSCNHHDYGYWKGCTEEFRKACDKKLRSSMAADCKRLSIIKKIRYIPWCELYYLAVRIKGKSFFHYGYRQQDPDIDL